MRRIGWLLAAAAAQQSTDNRGYLFVSNRLDEVLLAAAQLKRVDPHANSTLVADAATLGELASRSKLGGAAKRLFDVVIASTTLDIDEKEEDTKGKKKKGKKGKKASRAASITLAWSAFDPKEAVAAAFEKVSKFARRRPPTSALANRARRRNASEREGTEARARAGPFASLSLAVPFGPFSSK